MVIIIIIIITIIIKIVIKITIITTMVTIIIKIAVIKETSNNNTLKIIKSLYSNKEQVKSVKNHNILRMTTIISS